MSNVKLNPSGQLEHDHRLYGKITDASVYLMEDIFGDRHGEGEPGKQSAVWYLVTPHGSATIADYWTWPEGEYGVYCANDRVARIVVVWLLAHKVKAVVRWSLP